MGKPTIKKPTPVKRPRGRPSLYTLALAEEVCERLSNGETLQDICRSEHMPEVRTVNRWTEAHESFASDFAQARARGFDAIAAEALRIANTPHEGVEYITKGDGSEETRRGDMLGHRKLQIETRLKLLAKWDPKRYGEKLGLEHSGNIGIGERLRRAEERLKAENIRIEPQTR